MGGPGVSGRFSGTSGAKSSRYSGALLKSNKQDANADKLGRRIHGKSRVYFENDPAKREFDAVSKKYVAQTKPAVMTLGKAFREQMKATFTAAKETGRKVYYHFEGNPAKSVINKLHDYSKRYGVDVVIDIEPLNKK